MRERVIHKTNFHNLFFEKSCYRTIRRCQLGNPISKNHYVWTKSVYLPSYTKPVKRIHSVNLTSNLYRIQWRVFPELCFSGKQKLRVKKFKRPTLYINSLFLQFIYKSFARDGNSTSIRKQGANVYYVQCSFLW